MIYNEQGCNLEYISGTMQTHPSGIHKIPYSTTLNTTHGTTRTTLNQNFNELTILLHQIEAFNLLYFLRRRNLHDSIRN